MEDSETKYNALRDLYLKEGVDNDSISKGKIIEKLVNDLIFDIFKPFQQLSRIALGKNEFDGSIILGRGKSIFYEIQLGTLPKFKYYSLIETIMDAYSLSMSRVYFLVIAYSFQQIDHKRIQQLVEQIPQGSIKACFIDYETLIQLHKFRLKFEKYSSKEMKKMKLLFIEALLDRNTIISQSSFLDALVFAENRYHSEYKPALKLEKKEPPAQQVITLEEPNVNLERLENLEELVNKILREIRSLKQEAQREKTQQDHLRS